MGCHIMWASEATVATVIKGYNNTNVRCVTGPILTDQFDVSFRVQHQVLRLQVAVDDSGAVEVVEGLGHTAHAELGRCLVKTPSGVQRGVKVIDSRTYGKTVKTHVS